MSRPDVSAVIPVYNREGLIARAIDSVLGQTDLRVECIVVDDGSTDGTAEVLAGYGDRIVALTQENAGRSAARNRGLQEARADHVAFLDSDDAWLPQKCATQLAALTSDPARILSGHGILVAHEDGREEAKAPRVSQAELSEAPYESIMDRFFLFPSVMMVRTEEARAVEGFSTEYHGAEDLDFALKLARRGGVGVMSECLTRMYQHGGQTSRRQLAGENVRVLTHHLEQLELSPALREKLTRKIARYTLSVAKRAASREELIQLLDEAVRLDGGCRRRGTYWRLRWKSRFGRI